MNEAILAQHISKSYGNVQAVADVSFEVNNGELFGLIGPDGAGKSSIYRILATLSRPDKGDVRVLGLDTVKDYRQLRTKIGFMPDKFSLYPDLSVMENLRFFANLFGVSVKNNYALIAPIFSQLEKFPNRRAGDLSGGMKQKLALSCALIHRPEVLLLDEPTTGVDAVSRSEFWDMLGDLRKSGLTIMVSTSYMDEASRCDRVAMINHGKILMTDTSEKLASQLDECLYNAEADEMFPLLGWLREMEEVEDCYTFGATLHLVVRPGFNPERATQILEAKGMENVRIYPAKGTLEDLFIKLTTSEKENG